MLNLNQAIETYEYYAPHYEPELQQNAVKDLERQIVNEIHAYINLREYLDMLDQDELKDIVDDVIECWRKAFPPIWYPFLREVSAELCYYTNEDGLTLYSHLEPNAAYHMMWVGNAPIQLFNPARATLSVLAEKRLIDHNAVFDKNSLEYKLRFQDL